MNHIMPSAPPPPSPPPPHSSGRPLPRGSHASHGRLLIRCFPTYATRPLASLRVAGDIVDIAAAGEEAGLVGIVVDPLWHAVALVSPLTAEEQEAYMSRQALAKHRRRQSEAASKVKDNEHCAAKFVLFRPFVRIAVCVRSNLRPCERMWVRWQSPHRTAVPRDRRRRAHMPFAGRFPCRALRMPFYFFAAGSPLAGQGGQGG